MSNYYLEEFFDMSGLNFDIILDEGDPFIQAFEEIMAKRPSQNLEMQCDRLEQEYLKYKRIQDETQTRAKKPALGPGIGPQTPVQILEMIDPFLEKVQSMPEYFNVLDYFLNRIRVIIEHPFVINNGQVFFRGIQEIARKTGLDLSPSFVVELNEYPKPDQSKPFKNREFLVGSRSSRKLYLCRVSDIGDTNYLGDIPLRSYEEFFRQKHNAEFFG